VRRLTPMKMKRIMRVVLVAGLESVVQHNSNSNR
jgi:hypothetical protein